MIRRLFPVLLVCSSAAADRLPPQSLSISASTPTVAIERRAAGRGLVALPTLEFRFLLEPACAAGWQPRVVSLGIADTRLTLTPEAANAARLEAELTVPAAQLAPLAVAGFCEEDAASGDMAERATIDGDVAPPAETAAARDSELTVAAALSAQGALLCSSDEGERLTFVARPLDVTLVCSGAPAERPGGSQSD